MSEFDRAPSRPDCDEAHPAWRVLVVDDVRSIRDGLRLMVLGALGSRAQVETAATVAEALQCASQRPPDVVVLDVDLQGDDGLRLVRLLDAAVRIVVVTSHLDAGTRQRAEALGVRAFVGKHEPAERLLRHLAPRAPRFTGDQAPARVGTEVPGRGGASSVVAAAPSR